MTKHVFYVHSQTCYISSIKTIKYLKLKVDDVLILISRNTPLYKNKYKTYYIKPTLDNWPFYTQKDLFNFKWFKNKRVVNLYDKIIKYFIQSKFIFYSQNSRHYKYNLFISSPLCLSNHFIEDGLDMYSTNEEYNLKYPQPLKLRYLFCNKVLSKIQNLDKRLFQKNNPFWSKTGLSTFFGLSSFSFENILKEKKNLVNLHDIKIEFKLPNFRSEIPILLPSALDEQNITSNLNIAKSYIEFLERKKIKKVYIKWHPAHRSYSKKNISYNFKLHKIKIIEIDSAIPMELIFISSKNKLTLVSNGSSLLIYAVLFGEHKSFVIYPILHKINGSKTPRSKYWENTFNNFNFKNLFISK